MRAEHVKSVARRHGFELAGIAPALPVPDWSEYSDWVAEGMAGEMRYLTDHRQEMRADPRTLLPSVQSILCVGRLYNTPTDGVPIARYAQSADYHDTIRAGLTRVVEELRDQQDFDYRICVDTAPLLERSYARQAGLGWIGKNTCLIDERSGSWYLLGEVLLSLKLDADSPVPDRCGTCTRCIDACPTSAIVPGGFGHRLDSRLCISYLTIELKGDVPESLRAGVGNHVFGCDICQDVCPWNSRAPLGDGPPRDVPSLEQMAQTTPEQFREAYRHTPVWRSKHSGFLRNVAVAIGNSGDAALIPAAERLARSEDSLVSRHAISALQALEESCATSS